MGELPRWASRYQFTEELWRGRARLLLDPSLERALGRGELRAGFDEGALDALVAELLPERGEADAWMILERGRRAAAYARQFGGVVFADLPDAGQLASDEAWEVAMVDLTGVLEDAAPSGEGPLEERLSPPLAALLETLADELEGERTLVLSVPARETAGDRGCSLDAFAAYCEANFDELRLFALADARMVAAFEVGGPEDDEGEYEDEDEDEDEDTAVEVPPPFDAELRSQAREARLGPEDADLELEAEYDAELDAAEATWAGSAVDERDDADDEGEVSMSVDTSLAEAEPRFTHYLAVIAAAEFVREQVTYLELPELRATGGSAGTGAPGSATTHEGGAEAAALRAQLSQAQRQAELLALEKQRLLEELEDARDRIDELEEDASDEAAPAGRPGEPVGSGESAQDAAARVDGLLAREQELRWRLRELESRNAELMSRPVAEIEGENAILSERVGELEAQLATGSRAPSASRRSADGRAVAASSKPSPDPANVAGGWIHELLGRVDGILRRVERGGLPALELHISLRRLRERLARRR